MYVLTKQEVYIHIPKHNWVHNKDLHEKQMTQEGIHVYLKVWQNRHIHEVKHTNPKIGNTSLKCMNHQN